MFKSVYCKLVKSTLTGRLFHWATTRSAKTRFLTPLQWPVAYSIQRIFVAPSWVARPCVRAYGRSHFPTGFVSTSSFFQKFCHLFLKPFIDSLITLLAYYCHYTRISWGLSYDSAVCAVSVSNLHWCQRESLQCHGRHTLRTFHGKPHRRWCNWFVTLP